MEFLKRSDEVLSVGEFTRRFKMLLKTSVPEVWLNGEISNLKTYSSGHTYFTLKDAEASVSAVLFKGSSRMVSFQLREGMKIYAFGEISVFEQRGTYQLILRAALPDGSGELSAKFNALKQKLSDEGLFDASRKRQIPALPKNVAVITSPEGAAVRDFCRILKRRGWRGNVWILPSKVQGSGSAEEIVSQIKFAQKHIFKSGEKFDLLLLMRGGGSLEDLWSFNEEIVARAVAGSEIPTISAVGHEIDFTLSDFAADLRAETPSAAAEHISSAFVETLAEVRNIFSQISRTAENRLSSLGDKLDSLGEMLRLNSPKNRICNSRLALDEAGSRLDSFASEILHGAKISFSNAAAKFARLSPATRVELFRQKLEASAKQLELLGTEATLRRGFALAVDSRGNIVGAADISAGDIINLEFFDGAAKVRAESVGLKKPQR